MATEANRALRSEDIRGKLPQALGHRLHPDQGSRAHAMANFKVSISYVLGKACKETTIALQLRNSTYLATGYGIV